MPRSLMLVAFGGNVVSCPYAFAMLLAIFEEKQTIPISLRPCFRASSYSTSVTSRTARELVPFRLETHSILALVES